MPVVIPVLRPQLPSADRLLPYLRRIDSTRIYSNHGPLARELERRLAEHLRLAPGGLVSAASGTAALVGAILALAGRARPERPFAVVPAFTFVATASAVEQCGYRPYLADVDAESWMLDPDRLADHPERDRIGVVVPVAPFGRPVPQQPWRRFRERTGIPVVIDAAASFEGLSDSPERFLGDIPAALSFHATKSFATGEGGAVATSDLDLAHRAVQALNFGFYGSRDSQMPSINGKMSEYHAAVGLAELDGWPEKRAALNAVADGYRQLMTEAGLGERCIVAPDVASCYALFLCQDIDESSRLQQSLQNHGVDFRHWYGKGLQGQGYYADLSSDTLKVTDSVAARLLGLPVAPDLDEAAIERIVTACTAVRDQSPDPLALQTYENAITAHAGQIAEALRHLNEAIRRADNPATVTRLLTMRVIRASGLFDDEYYLSSNPDVREGGMDPLDHYVRHGDAEGRRSNPFFSSLYYRAAAMPGAPSSENALAHYVEIGERAGRRASGIFDPRGYLDANPGLSAFVDRPLFHLLKIGRRAGLTTPDIGDLLTEAPSAIDHLDKFLASGQSQLYQLMRTKQALVAGLGLDRGFAAYKALLALPGSERIERKNLASLYDVAKAKARLFHEIAASGEPFTVAPPHVAGEGNQRTLQSFTRSVFVTCLDNARIRSSSGFIEFGDLALLDFEYPEFSRPDDELEFDRTVFHASDDAVWLTAPDDAANISEIEEAFNLVGAHSDAFGHWILEYLPKYIIATIWGKMPPIPVLIDEGMPETHRQALELLLPEGVEIIVLPRFATARIQRLWCAPSPSYMAVLPRIGDIDKFAEFVPPPARLASVMREMAARLEPLTAKPTGRDRIFLARKSFLHRKLLNYEAIYAAAAARGFQTVYTEDLGFIEQVRLLRHARFVIAPNGSASMLAFLARPGTKLCVLSHPYTVELQELTGAFAELGIEVTVLTGPYVRFDTEYPHFSDYEIDENAFGAFVDAWVKKEGVSRLAFTETRTPRIAALLGVMDEIELIERTVDHLYAVGVDLIVAVDMGSTDGTLDFLKSRCSEERLWLVQPKLQGQELIDAWPAIRLDLLKAGIEWVIFGDADEYPIPATGRLKDCIPNDAVDQLIIRQLNVPLGPDGPLMPDRLTPAEYDQLFLLVQSIPDLRKYLDEHPDAVWIHGATALKMMAKLSRVAGLQEGMHGIVPAGLGPVRCAYSNDLFVAQVPFTSFARFERKIDNARRDLANCAAWGGDYANGNIAWHWHRWVRLANEGRLRQEYDQSRLDWVAVAELRGTGALRSAAEIFENKLGTKSEIEAVAVA